MILKFKVDQKAAFREGRDAPSSVAQVDVDPVNLPGLSRRCISDLLRDDGSFVSGIVATSPTLDGLLASLQDRVSREAADLDAFEDKIDEAEVTPQTIIHLRECNAAIEAGDDGNLRFTLGRGNPGLGTTQAREATARHIEPPGDILLAKDRLAALIARASKAHDAARAMADQRNDQMLTDLASSEVGAAVMDNAKRVMDDIEREMEANRKAKVARDSAVAAAVGRHYSDPADAQFILDGIRGGAIDSSIFVEMLRDSALPPDAGLGEFDKDDDSNYPDSEYTDEKIEPNDWQTKLTPEEAFNARDLMSEIAERGGVKPEMLGRPRRLSWSGGEAPDVAYAEFTVVQWGLTFERTYRLTAAPREASTEAPNTL